MLSFAYHFGGVLVGPQYPFAIYDRFVKGTLMPSPRYCPRAIARPQVQGVEGASSREPRARALGDSCGANETR